MRQFFYAVSIIFIIAALAAADVPASNVTMSPKVRKALARMAKEAGNSNLARMLQSRKQNQALNTMSRVSDILNVSVPLLLGRYSDAANSFSRSDFHNQIFANNPTGTMIDYYREVSNGQFELSGGTFGWYALPETQDFYVGGKSGLGGGGARFARDLAVAADSDVDFSQYDADDDGYVDVIMVVHTGAGAETGVSSNIWSHRWNLNAAASVNPDLLPEGEYVTNDPRPGHPGEFIKVNDYIIQPELARSTGGLVNIGVFCHEFGHAIGLPDLYDTDGSSEGIGNWGLMAGGSYGGDGNHSNYPAHMCAWSKEFLGWVKPMIIEQESLNVAIMNSEKNANEIYKIYLNGEPGPEYFLIENRQKVGFDRYLSGAGLLIWHIDQDVIDARLYSNSVNNDEQRKGVDLEEADGRADLDFGRSRGDAGDPFPGIMQNHLFNSSSNPGSESNDGEDSGVAIRIDSLVNQIVHVTFLQKPELYVTPVQRSVSYDSGRISFDIRNLGGGLMNWTATTNTPWLFIVGNSTGINKGELVVGYQENTESIAREGVITVATESAGLVELLVTQSRFGEWVLAMDVQDKGGEGATLSFGQRFGATDGLDADLGESALAAAPSSGVFDARFELIDGESASLNDFRAPGGSLIQWRMLFQAGPGGYPIQLMWDRYQLPGGSFIIQDEFTGTLITVDMKLTDRYVVPTSSIKSLKITYSDVGPQTVNAESGWNLISIPFTLSEAHTRSVFPGAASRAFLFDGVYKAVEQLIPGRAYWLKFQQQTRTTLFGAVVVPQEIELKRGWNMVGPFEKEESIASIVSDPTGIIVSDFFEFSGAYKAVDVLTPGRGYWVRAADDGKMIFAGQPVAKASREVEPTWVILTFTDAKNRRKSLYVADRQVDGFYLPPLPPGPAWDVRFEDDRQVCVANGSREIMIRGAAFPVTVSIVNGEAFKLTLNGAELLSAAEPEQVRGSVYQIAHASQLQLTSEQLPAEYQLKQNYPNPFNSGTTIRFALPAKERALLSIYNARGQLLETMVDEVLEAGRHSATFDASRYASGLYFYTLQAGDFSMTKEMILLR